MAHSSITQLRSSHANERAKWPQLAATLASALKHRDRAEQTVIVATLALEGQGADFDWRIARELKSHAWQELSETYCALQEAMNLIPQEYWPEGFTLDDGALSHSESAEENDHA